MSEKLAAFVTIYNEKATSDIEKAKSRLAKAEERFNRSTELWDSIKAATEKLGIIDKFLSVFPEPGGKAILSSGTNVNPNYLTLLDYGDPLKGLVNELATELDRSTQKLNSAKNSLKLAESLLARKPEDHANILRSSVAELTANSSSLGADSPDALLKAIFKDYEEFKDFIELNVEGVDGPSGVNTSQPAFDLLKDMFEAGESNSVINEVTEGLSKDFEKISMSPLNEANVTSEPSSIVLPEAISIPLDFPKEIVNEEPQQISINLESSPVSEASTVPDKPVESEVINQSQPQTLPESEVINQSQPQTLPESEVINQRQPQTPLNASLDSSEPIRSTVRDDLNQAISTSTSEKEFYNSLFGESFTNRSTINELNKVTSRESIAESTMDVKTANTSNNNTAVNSTISKNKSLSETLKLIEQSYGFNTDSPKSNETEEVTQTKIDLPSSTVQNNAQPGVALSASQSSQPNQAQMADVSQKSEEVSAKSASINEVSEKPEMTQMPTTNMKTEIDLSALEQRLARIEYALSFPLEVKIVS